MVYYLGGVASRPKIAGGVVNNSANGIPIDLTVLAPIQTLTFSNGIATVLLVFHPYYRDSFAFETGPDEMVDGRPAVPVRLYPT